MTCSNFNISCQHGKRGFYSGNSQRASLVGRCFLPHGASEPPGAASHRSASRPPGAGRFFTQLVGEEEDEGIEEPLLRAPPAVHTSLPSVTAAGGRGAGSSWDLHVPLPSHCRKRQNKREPLVERRPQPPSVIQMSFKMFVLWLFDSQGTTIRFQRVLVFWCFWYYSRVFLECVMVVPLNGDPAMCQRRLSLPGTDVPASRLPSPFGCCQAPMPGFRAV